jgi:hypothetical protein
MLLLRQIISNVLTITRVKRGFVKALCLYTQMQMRAIIAERRKCE